MSNLFPYNTKSLIDPVLVLCVILSPSFVDPFHIVFIIFSSVTADAFRVLLTICFLSPVVDSFALCFKTGFNYFSIPILYATVFAGSGFSPCSLRNISYGRPSCHPLVIVWSNSSCVTSWI